MFIIVSTSLCEVIQSCPTLFVTPWTVTYQAPPSMGFSRQEYWSGLPFPSPGDLPDSGIEPRSPALQADALSPEPPGKPLCTSEPPEKPSTSLIVSNSLSSDIGNIIIPAPSSLIVMSFFVNFYYSCINLPFI